MKKFIIILFFAILGLSCAAQSIWKPVNKQMFQKDGWAVRGDLKPSVWLWRFSAAVTAVELTWNKETKKFNSQPLSSAGPSIGYRHYSALPTGEPYNDFGVNLALLLGTDITQITPASIKAALLINAFQFINVGADYDFTNKTPGILIGASINF